MGHARRGNLPAARTGGAGFTANGAMYLVGGTDGKTTRKELYWALPDSKGNLPGGWRHLDADGPARPGSRTPRRS